MKAEGAGHRGHAGRAVVRDLPGERVVAAAPEAGAVTGVAAVVDVQGGDADAVTRARLEVAHHVADAGVAGDVHALAVGIRELGPDGAGEAEAERGHVAPAEVTAGDLRLVHGAGLIARVARVR